MSSPGLPEDAVAIGGGSINRAYRCTWDGRPAFLKTRPGATEYADEARQLDWLRAAGSDLGVPEVLDVADDRLVLVWVEEGGAPDPERLGRGLAQLHRAGADGLGAPWPYGFGDLWLGNEDAPSWAVFYAERRLRPLGDRAGIDVEGVCARLAALVPEEPVARLHGDLWSGNVLGDRDGRPWLVDPAAHGGHREVDLAMLRLFGAPPARFWDAYDEVWPRADGHEERVELFGLLPLLVHAVLFGGSYVASARRIAQRFA